MATLSSERQGQIDALIDQVRLRTERSYPKDSLLDICKALGVTVHVTKLPGDLDLPDNGQETDGVILWDEDGTARIAINEAYSPTRRTFTLAHELGHFLLHPRQQKYRIDTFDYAGAGADPLEETEANYFAASFLMPKAAIDELLRITTDTAAIAKYFGVSQEAVANRVKWLQTN